MTGSRLNCPSGYLLHSNMYVSNLSMYPMHTMSDRSIVFYILGRRKEAERVTAVTRSRTT